MNYPKQKGNWNQARLHRLSVQPGKIKVINPEPSSQLFQSCSNTVDKVPIQMNENTKQLQCLGFGFPLYYSFLKYAIIMIFLLVISYSCMTLAWAIDHNNKFCIKKQTYIQNGDQISCTSWMILFSRLQHDVDVNQNILRGMSFILLIFFLLFIRDSLRKQNFYFQERREFSVSDVSLMYNNIPLQTKLKQKINNLYHLFGKQNIVEKIIYIPNLQNYYSLKEQLDHDELNLNRNSSIHQRDSKLYQMNQMKININSSSERLDNCIRQQKQKMDKDESLCQRIIVIFKTQEDHNFILQHETSSQTLIHIFGEEGNKIKVREAPQPSQIIWENINIPKQQKIKRIISGWAMFVILLTVITTIFYFILEFKTLQVQKALHQYKNNPIQAENYKNIAKIIVYSSIFSIILFNKLFFSALLYLITKTQKHKTAAAFELSLSIKYALGLFFTTAIMTLLVENIRFHNIYQHDYGVIEQETIMFFMNAFFVPLIWFINPWYCIKIIKIFFLQNTSTFNQAEANQLMQDPQYSIGKRYAQIIESVWFTYLYASIIPIGAFIIMIGLGLFYWIDKYNLLRKSSLKKKVFGDLNMKALIMLDLTVVLKPLGQIIFDGQIRTEWNYQSLICLVFGVIYLAAPLNNILDWINGQKFNMKKQSKGQFNEQILKGYEKQHPIYTSLNLNVVQAEAKQSTNKLCKQMENMHKQTEDGSQQSLR